MKLQEFKIGETFWCSGRQYRCTDVGTRVVLGIRIDGLFQIAHAPEGTTDWISYEQAKEQGWFNGPPYAVSEHVFDEDDLSACEPDHE